MGVGGFFICCLNLFMRAALGIPEEATVDITLRIANTIFMAHIIDRLVDYVPPYLLRG